MRVAPASQSGGGGGFGAHSDTPGSAWLERCCYKGERLVLTFVVREAMFFLLIILPISIWGFGVLSASASSHEQKAWMLRRVHLHGCG